ncbi:MAG: DUF1624 domain-containing protein [Methylocystis sp.]|nr:DUF1624 domain-containing protein [Methylocystis sp.]MBI3275890.1 DUF1624 domain-containing protein [Methylocystis sp.]
MTAFVRRLAAIDAARGLAVLAMFVFHFTWDLGHFGYIDAGFPYSRGFKLFGHTIAFAFLFIAGVCLALAHAHGVRWASFWRRLAIVTGAALLVSLGTYAVFSNAFVFFGILHCIAASSLLAAPFLLLPWPAALIAAAAAALAPDFARNPFFDAPQWWWTGLSTFEPLTNDYRPVLPWMSAMLAGVAGMKAARAWGGLPLPLAGEGGPAKPGRVRADEVARPARPSSVAHSRDTFSREREKDSASRIGSSAPLRGLTLLGRHSLLLYLVHQPLFFAAFSAAALLAPPPVAQDMRSFETACATQCVAAGGKNETCRAACACTAAEIARRHTLSGVAEDAERARRIGAVARECLPRPK